MTTSTKNNIRFAFFGTDPLAIPVLNELEQAGLVPSLIVAGQDQRIPRTSEKKPSPEKKWALDHNVPVIQPTHIDEKVISGLKESAWDVFVVASYGKILPQEILSLPRKGVVNLHPSLLPRLRGPSPIRSAILAEEKRIGVSIMLMDKEMDHGPLLAQEEVPIEERPPHGIALDKLLAERGAQLLARTLPDWLSDEVMPKDQNHSGATYCSSIKKEDGLLDLKDDAHKNLLKIRAYEGWPGTYAFFERNGERIRVVILDARLTNKELVIERVKPEGKREMTYEEFLRSGAMISVS